MSVKLKKPKHNPEVLLRALAKGAVCNADGTVSYDAMDYDEHLASLVAMIDFGRGSDWQSCEAAVGRSVSKAIRESKYSRESFIAYVSEALHAERAKKPEQFYLLTSISITWDGLPFKTVSHGGCSVSFYKKFPVRFRSRLQKEKDCHFTENATPKGYTTVVVATKARNEFEAAEKCLWALEVIRALLCLRLNYAMQAHWGLPAAPKTRNKISIGRLHTIHDATGDSPGDQYWYEAKDGVAAVWRPQKSEQPAQLRKALSAAIRRLSASRYGRDIERALVRYVQAFDEPDDNEAIPKLWSALETIAAINNADYDALVRRTAATCVDVPLHTQHLSALREIRNAIVHEGARSRSSLTHCYQLQAYFRRLARFHIACSLDYTSLAEANQFFDLPVNIKDLNHMQTELRRAIRYHRPRGTPCT